MSDLSLTTADQERAASDRNDSRKQPGADLILARRDLVLALLCAACVTPPAAVNRPAVKVEVWVDAYAGSDGDGTRSQPFKRVPALLDAGTVLHLASGLYKGPFTFPDELEVQGQGTAVLFLDEPGVVATVRRASFENVSFQGGSVGLVASQRVRVQDVHFSGFKSEALHLGEGAEGVVSASEVVGTVSQSKGLVVEGGTLTARGCRFRGALTRAVDVQRGVVSLEQVTAEGVGSLLHAVDSTVTVRAGEASAGRGPAIFAAGGVLTVRGLTVLGHEYGVLAVRARVDLDEVNSRDAQFSGVTLQRCSGSASRVRVSGAGSLGGLQIADAEGVLLRDVSVSGAESTGILVRRGAVTLQSIRIENVHREGESQGEPLLGDGLQLRDARVTMEDVGVRDVEGSAVWLGAFAEVVSGKLEVERTGSAGVVVERGSSLTAKKVFVNGAHGPAVLAMDGAKVKLGSLTSIAAEAPVWAECEQEVEVSIEALITDVTFPASACVTIKARSGPAAR